MAVKYFFNAGRAAFLFDYVAAEAHEGPYARAYGYYSQSKMAVADAEGLYNAGGE